MFDAITTEEEIVASLPFRRTYYLLISKRQVEAVKYKTVSPIKQRQQT